MDKPKKEKKDKSNKPHGLPDAELAAKYDNGVSVDFANAVRIVAKTPPIKPPKQIFTFSLIHPTILLPFFHIMIFVVLKVNYCRT